MRDVARKKREAAVYDHSDEKYAKRPAMKSFFEPELFARMVGYEYHGDLKRMMDKYVKRKKVLVLGASRTDIDLVAPYTKKITAIDISSRMVREIKKVYPEIKAKVHDAEDLVGLGEKFEVVWGKSILHHLHPFEEVMEQIAEVLEKDGVLMAAGEPGIYNPLAWLGRKLTPTQDHTPDEKPFEFGKYERVLAKRFEREYVNYYFLVSMMTVVGAAKMPWLKRVLAPGLVPLLRVEKWLRKIPGMKRWYWLTVGVYRLR